MTAPKEWAVFLEKAVQSYQTFASSPPPMDAKEFNAYHGACKSALMHIALLEKLIELNPEKPPDSFPLDEWIQAARQELKNENDLS